MSGENVELTLRLSDAFNRREVDAGLWDDEAVWSPALEALTEGRRNYRGVAGLHQYYEDLAEFAEGAHVEWTDLRDLGDQVLAVGRLSMRFTSGVELEQETACLFAWRDGKCVEARGFMSLTEAIETAGLPE